VRRRCQREVAGCAYPVTTIARAWVAEDPAHRARVSRDDFRSICHDGSFVKGGTEQAITAARNATIRTLLDIGLDVVCDDPNLPNCTIRDLRNLAELVGAAFAVVDRTDVPVETCVDRDAARENGVGREVIVDLHQRFVKGKPYPLPRPETPPGPGNLEPYEPEPEPRVRSSSTSTGPWR